MSTTSVEAPPVTLRTFLVGGPDDGEATKVLSRAIGGKVLSRASLGSVRHLSASAVRTVDHEVGAVAARLLSMDLGDALVAGWRKYQALTDAARRTRQSPDSEEVLALASHRVTCRYSPRVDLVVDEIRVTTFEFEATLTFDLTGLSAVVAGGSLVALSGGECLATGTLSLEGAVIVQRQQNFDPLFVLALHRPIPLLQPTVPTPPMQRTSAEGEHSSAPESRQ